MLNTLKIGLLGVGNVGLGVVSILDRNADLIEKRTGKRIIISKALVRASGKKRDLPSHITLTESIDDIVNDPDISIVVEALGGEYPAFDYIEKALKNKKFVVTANKEVVSKHKQYFFELAKQNGVDIYFEASVGGGIPLIRSLKVGYAANNIQQLYGILNGTTNYILTQIAEKNLEFNVALKAAQDLGFAEADPTMDVSGLDAAYKLVILAAVGFKADITIKDVYYEGITAVGLNDIVYAKEMGYAIKLLAIGKRYENDKMSFKVHPTLVPLTHPLAGVRNELNAVFIVGDQVGESMLSGKGAGGAPTGSAVVSDIIDIAFDTEARAGNKRNLEDQISKVNLVPHDETESQFYIRLLLADTPGVLAKVTAILAQQSISVLKLIQKGEDASRNEAEAVIITHSVQEKKMTQAIQQLKEQGAIKSLISVFRVGL